MKLSILDDELALNVSHVWGKILKYKYIFLVVFIFYSILCRNEGTSLIFLFCVITSLEF